MVLSADELGLIAEMRADGHFEHRIDLGTTYTLEHKAEAEQDVCADEDPVDDIGDDVDGFYADE